MACDKRDRVTIKMALNMINTSYVWILVVKLFMFTAVLFAHNVAFEQNYFKETSYIPIVVNTWPFQNATQAGNFFNTVVSCNNFTYRPFK
jgi:hypothetical protein